MDVEIGIENTARPVHFSTKDSVDSVTSIIKDAAANGSVAQFTNEKGETVLVNCKSLAYAIVGVEEPRHVGFGM
ncbi:ATP-binding protein [Pseudoscardovia radai]|uniref:ATP-binding protein n=1 Tax=Pseudoscardovia radai TaxID=987066 RepID=A0A261EYV0_9BIFI|nr:DUF3107 domain-containing protein [Pseudoscardovia radai]MDO5688573.1 DUF3107 domain-containing protein [Pseudoscardovia radai]OZG51846.1 ATP-binding protein [Pseudoscardovia radai]